jgi:hypothetical protein
MLDTRGDGEEIRRVSSDGCDIDLWANEQLDALRAEAEAIIADYYGKVLPEGKSHPKSERGRVGVRVRDQRGARATQGSFTIEWVEYFYVNRNPSSGSRAFTRYLPRGKTDRYPRSAFNRLAKPWQLKLIHATEDRLAQIRTLARSIGKVRAQMHAHHKLAQRLRGEGFPEDSN